MDTKTSIMECAVKLFASKGYDAVSVQEITTAANITKPTLYYYFGSKEALIREAFIAYFDKAVRDFETYMNEGHTLKEKIERIIDMKTTYRDFPPSVIKRLLREDIELARYIEVLYREVTIPLTIRIIQEGQSSGEISPDVSVENVLVFMQLYMNQYETLLDMADKSTDREKFLQGMVEMFFYGLCGRR